MIINHNIRRYDPRIVVRRKQVVEDAVDGNIVGEGGGSGSNYLQAQVFQTYPTGCEISFALWAVLVNLHPEGGDQELLFIVRHLLGIKDAKRNILNRKLKEPAVENQKLVTWHPKSLAVFKSIGIVFGQFIPCGVQR